MKDSLRSPIVLPGQARWSAKYSSDSIASKETAPAPKGLLPPATGDLGCAVQNEYQQLPGLFRGSAKDTHAAISDIKCRPVGDVGIQGPPCFTNAMPKGPVSRSHSQTVPTRVELQL